MRFLPTVLVSMALGCGISVSGTELIHLASGFDLEAQSHVRSESTVTLVTTTGTIEVPAGDVQGIDELKDPIAVVSKPATPSAPDFGSMITLIAAEEANTPEFIHFVRCVAQVESALRQDVHSAKGATGLMQLMPATARKLGVAADDARENVRGGARYLRELLIRYHSNSVLALAAYNAGPGAVKKYGGVPPYMETRRYIRQVLEAYAKIQIHREPTN